MFWCFEWFGVFVGDGIGGDVIGRYVGDGVGGMVGDRDHDLVWRTQWQVTHLPAITVINIGRQR